MNPRGYSLVELMVSVAIIGLLAALAVPNYQLFADRAKIGRAKADMSGMRAAAMALRSSVDASLPEAMGTFSTAFYVQGRNSGARPVCLTPNNAIAQFQKLSYDQPPFDAWGQCYLLDENEGENGPNDCRFDAIISGGPNGIWAGSGDGDDVFDDDVMIRIPHFYEHPGCTGSLDGQFGGTP